MENVKRQRTEPDVLAAAEALCRIKAQENEPAGGTLMELEQAESVLASWRDRLPEPAPGARIHSLKCDG
jgi:hypothetical protein